MQTQTAGQRRARSNVPRSMPHGVEDVVPNVCPKRFPTLLLEAVLAERWSATSSPPRR